MGGYNYVDTLTGTSIGDGQPIVAFLVADDGPSAFSPYGIGSLPIRGRMSGDDKITPDQGQLSVALATRICGVDEWHDLVPDRDSIVVMHASTWDHLMQVHGWTDERGADVDIVMNVYVDLHNRISAKAPSGEDADGLVVQSHDLFDVSAYNYRAADGMRDPLPAVASSLSNKASSPFSDRFRDWLQAEVLEPAHDEWDSDGAPMMREMLEGLWDVEAFSSTMLRLNRCIRPSTVTRDTNSQADQFAVALLAARQCGEQALTVAEGIGEETGDTERLEGMLSEMAAIRDGFAARLNEIRSPAFPSPSEG
ncbi:MAG: hypothetical protein ACRYGG_17015 [Janthinobacterium lividum]